MERVTIVGAGLVGSVLAMFLARRGCRVRVFDRRPDPRARRMASGRSINLTLCERGFRALDRIEVGDRLRRLAIPAYGRVMHDSEGRVTYQPYGSRGEAIYSVSRNGINRELIHCAEECRGVALSFRQECLEIDLERPAVRVRDRDSGRETWVESDVIFGADGAFSFVRYRLQRLDRFRFDYSQSFVPQGYKELRLPPGPDGSARLKRDAIHIWPRGPRMLIGFANLDGSFTVALHMPFEGAPSSFADLESPQELLEYFRRDFPDALRLLPDLARDFFAHPVTSMITVRCFPWTFAGKLALIGDAAHAIVPSYGQGANSGFEDCSVLADCLDQAAGDWRSALEEYERRRKPEADAIADLALDHFAELQELVADPVFLLRKRLERRMEELYPQHYRSLYSMISFTDMPYTEALRRDREQRRLVDRLLALEAIETFDDAEVDREIHQLFA